MAKERVKLFSVSIKDCNVECIASTGGAGGQNKNRRHTAVRITHEPSGAIGFSADEREQHRNKVQAFGRMARSPLFQVWARTETARLGGRKSIEQLVEEDLRPKNLKLEVKDTDGKWIETKEIKETDE